MALVLLRERREGSRSPWHPYLSHLPRAYDLLGDWTDAQLDEHHERVYNSLAAAYANARHAIGLPDDARLLIK